MIFHLAAGNAFEPGETYRPDSLDTEGFVHCSMADQLVRVANERYPGREDLVLLTIDERRLSSPVVCEDCHETGERFPHVYGPIDPAAVVEVGPFRPGPGGTFTWERG